MTRIDKKDRIIALIEGDSGSGKSYFFACLKNAVVYDTDLGGGLKDYETTLEENGSERVEVSSYTEILADIKQRLRTGKLKESICIDHVTGLHQDAIMRYNPNQDSDYGRSGNKATYEWRQVRELARTFDCNLFCAAHLKAEYANDKVVGKIADGAKNIEGDMHIVLRLDNLKDNMGRKRYPGTAYVVKWRRDPKDPRGLPPDNFKFTVEEFGRIHGADYLRQRDKVVTVSEETLATLQGKLTRIDPKLAEGYVKEWLKKEGVDSLDLIQEVNALKCIEFIDKKIQEVK